MSAKDNFAQAMKELLNGENDAPGVEADERPVAPSSFSSFSQPDPRPARAGADEEDDRQASEAPRYSSFSAPAVEYTPPPVLTQPAAAPAPEFRSVSSSYSSQPTFSIPTPPPVAPAEPPPPAAVQVPVMPVDDADSGEMTVIAAGTTVMGDVTTAAGMRVNGNVKGNLKVASLLEMEGKVIGDIEAGDAVFLGSVVRGNINVTGSLTIDENTTIVGDVVANNVDVDGKIKGNLTVEERGRFQSNAVLVGNLMAGTVSIDEGAMLKGDISITTMDGGDNMAEPSFDIG